LPTCKVCERLTCRIPSRPGLRYDKPMNHILLVAVGGALGSLARYLTGLATLRWFGPGFPWGTLAVNILGGLAIGIFAELIARRFDGSAELRLFIVTGILGGFTTFSAFSLEVSAMVERGDYMTAMTYVLISVIISVAAVFAGLALVRAFV
jgi:CrcB protein